MKPLPNALLRLREWLRPMTSSYLATTQSLLADGHAYLKHLAASQSGFEKRFAALALRLGLANALTQAELQLLREAAWMATLCKISFNGQGGCGGRIKPEREPHRIQLEQAYMRACGAVYASRGWRALPDFTRDPVERILLRVLVLDANLTV